MSAIDYLHAAPQDDLPTSAAATDLLIAESSAGRRPRAIGRALLGGLALIPVLASVIAFRVWIFMPATFHLHG